MIIDPYRFGNVVTDPFAAFSWHHAYWASDPSWSNPGDGGACTTWRDGSGNSRTLSFTNGPLYRAAYTNLNSKPAVEFNGTSQYGSVSYTSVPQPYTMILIGLSTTGTSAGGRFVDGTGTLGSGRAAMLIGAGNDWRLNAGTTLIDGSANTSKHFVRGFANGASSAIGADESMTTGNAGSGGKDNTILARDDAGSLYLTGAIAFFGLYAGDITSQPNWSAFKTWANTTYGLSVA